MIFKWKAWNSILVSIGLVLVIFSLLWLLVIFPTLAKLPADHHQVVNFEGVYEVMNPDTRKLEEIQVSVKREQQATEIRDNVLIINQTVTSTNAVSGEELPKFGLAEVLGVERSLREYVPGYGDMERSGQFCFPEKVEKKSYYIWIPTTNCPLETSFTGEEDYQGLRVFTFKISEQDLDIGTYPGTSFPRILDIEVNMKVEPVSGVTVYSESLNTIKVVPMPNMKIAVYISSLRFTDDTIADLVDIARSSRSMLLWARVYGFWLVVGLGIALTLVGIAGATRGRPKEMD